MLVGSRERIYSKKKKKKFMFRDILSSSRPRGQKKLLHPYRGMTPNSLCLVGISRYVVPGVTIRVFSLQYVDVFFVIRGTRKAKIDKKSSFVCSRQGGYSV